MCLGWKFLIRNRFYLTVCEDYLKHKPLQSEAAMVSYAPIFSWGDDGGELFLYGDDCIPTESGENWAAYAARLNALCRWRVRSNQGVLIFSEEWIFSEHEMAHPQ